MQVLGNNTMLFRGVMLMTVYLLLGSTLLPGRNGQSLVKVFTNKVEAQVPRARSSLVFITYIAQTELVGFGQCNPLRPVLPPVPTNSTCDGLPLEPLTPTQATAVAAGALWFGSAIWTTFHPLIQNCSGISVRTGSLDLYTFLIYSGPVPDGCKVTWARSQDYLHAFVHITSTSFFWSLSMPLVTSAHPQMACLGPRSFCPASTQTACQDIFSFPQLLTASGDLPQAKLFTAMRYVMDLTSKEAQAAKTWAIAAQDSASIWAKAARQELHRKEVDYRRDAEEREATFQDEKQRQQRWTWLTHSLLFTLAAGALAGVLILWHKSHEALLDEIDKIHGQADDLRWQLRLNDVPYHPSWHRVPRRREPKGFF